MYNFETFDNNTINMKVIFYGIIGTILLSTSSCTETVYTTQQGQTLHSYKAQQYHKITKKDMRPKNKRKKKQW